MREAVSISEIREWANKTLDSVEASGVNAVDFEPHLYWMLETDEVWRADRQPGLVAGDSQDDVMDIRRDLAEPLGERASYAWHTLDHLIGVLIRVSATLKGYDFSRLEKAK